MPGPPTAGLRRASGLVPVGNELPTAQSAGAQSRPRLTGRTSVKLLARRLRKDGAGHEAGRSCSPARCFRASVPPGGTTMTDRRKIVTGVFRNRIDAERAFDY